MSEKLQLYFLINLFTIPFLFSQTTVHLQSGEFGRGILKARAGECFVITPLHVVEGGAGSVTISGERNVQSTGVFTQGFPGDLAVVRVTGGGQQDCTDWTTAENYDDILSNAIEGFLELRREDGSTSLMQIFMLEKTTDFITIEPKRPDQSFAKGMSGASLYTLVNGKKVYLGMLQEVDSESGYGYVLQADDMERILGGFFDENETVENKEPKKAIIQSDPVRQDTKPRIPSDLVYEELGFRFELIDVRKTGTRVTCKFKVVSKEKDANLGMYYTYLSMYDENGRAYTASNIVIGNSTGTNVNHLLVQGVPVIAEITFDNVVSSAKGISLLQVNFNDDSRKGKLEYRNLSFSGIDSGLVLPQVKGQWSQEVLGFDFQMVEYKKTGSKVVCKFMVRSKEKDNKLGMYYTYQSMYDENGLVNYSSNILIGNSSGTNVNHYMVQGVQVPMEVTFDNVTTSAQGISLLSLNFQDGEGKSGQIEIRNISFEGFSSALVLPQVKGEWSQEVLGFDFQMVEYKKTGSKVVCKFMVRSVEKDNKLGMYYTYQSMYDENGLVNYSSNILIGNSSGTNVNHYMVQGVQVPMEVTFDNVTTSAQGISLLSLNFQDGDGKSGQIEIRNISFEGFSSTLVLPQVKGEWSQEVLGFDFQMVEYKKTGSKVVCKFMVRSEDKDNKLGMYYTYQSMYDENGLVNYSSNILIGNSSGTNVNHYMVQGVQVPMEVTFDNVTTSAEGISLLSLNFQDGDGKNGQIEIRNISFEGFSSALVPPQVKGIRSQETLGFDFQLMECKKTGSSVRCYFRVTSKDKDNKLGMYYSYITMIGDQGKEAQASNISIGNSSGTNVNHYMVQGVQVPLEITFDNIASSGIAVLKITFSDDSGKNDKLEFRDLSLL